MQQNVSVTSFISPISYCSLQKDAPVCAVCRTHVKKEGAMIANITLDNAVQRHVDALGENGAVEWQRDGAKLVEWTIRKL